MAQRVKLNLVSDATVQEPVVLMTVHRDVVHVNVMGVEDSPATGHAIAALLVQVGQGLAQVLSGEGQEVPLSKEPAHAVHRDAENAPAARPQFNPVKLG